MADLNEYAKDTLNEIKPTTMRRFVCVMISGIVVATVFLCGLLWNATLQAEEIDEMKIVLSETQEMVRQLVVEIAVLTRGHVEYERIHRDILSIVNERN